ncbi:AAA family ATPase [Bilophila wadsworthia]|uniref:AAA family ATPase n=1 Tax=Bilophila wadsworthia TaxID=35833 RepID=UPI0035224C89
MIRAEYVRFLQTLNAEGISNEVRKIGNLVLQHLDVLIPLSTAQGQRIKEIVKLAQEGWSSVSSDIQPPPAQTEVQTFSITRLEKLSVGPFRGFSKQEDFDLAGKFVLIYGPNGTGKSSFCEALEFGLLGTVAEAESKRFRNQQDYLKNAHTKNFVPPIIIGKDSQGKDIPVSTNEALFRFCFVEKTRIDNFSRIAAQTPSKQSELISTLFGLDAYAEFTRNFTDAMDGKYIDLEGAKAKDLSVKQLTLAGHQQQLRTTIPEELQRIENEEENLASAYRKDCTFAQMITDLRGPDGKSGLIKELEDVLQTPLTLKSNLTVSNLHTIQASVETSIAEFNVKQGELSKSSQQLSFKQLYEAVTQLKINSPEKCPACQTLLSHVEVNPFEYADAELKKLEHLGQLQKDLEKIESDLATSIDKIARLVDSCCMANPENNPLSEFRYANKQSTTIAWWHSLHQKLADGFTPWQYAEIQVKQLENADKEIAQAALVRQQKQAELTRLRKFAEEVVKLQTRREAINNTKKQAADAIEKFDAENALLIEGVGHEKAIVAQNKAIANAYAAFVQELNVYKNSLPAQLVADLGETVVKLYNAFNRNDEDSEQLFAVHLPLQQNQRLEISFKNDQNTFYDALHILSEGHIRCLGLAILAAKNIKENCPLLIFDDPVNAIDDDHREAIRRTLFEDSFFNTKQIILTCHGEEFFKDIQNLLPTKAASQSKIVSFLTKSGDSHIRVDHNCSSRNYIIAARAHYSRSEIRDALGKSRQALESLTKGKVWRYISKHGDGNLSIKMRSATAPIELRNLTEQLRKQLSKSDFSADNKDAVLNPIEALLGVCGDSREWVYLNKGTHEEADRAEFDRQTVNQIITALEQLDAAFG